MKKIKTAPKQGQSIAIVAGGEVSVAFLPIIRAATLVIGVDRGALWLLEHDIIPHIALGDFDSISKRELKFLQQTIETVKIYPAEKNATDLELAIDYAIEEKPQSVTLLGVLGRRFDHAMGALSMLRKLESHNISGEIVDNFSKIYIVRRQRKKISREPSYPYVSIIPLEGATSLSLKGFRYPVQETTFSMYGTLGISNEILHSFAYISVHRGSVLVIHSSDVPVRQSQTDLI